MASAYLSPAWLYICLADGRCQPGDHEPIQAGPSKEEAVRAPLCDAKQGPAVNKIYPGASDRDFAKGTLKELGARSGNEEDVEACGDQQQGKPLLPKAKGTEQEKLFPEPYEGQECAEAVQQELSAWRDAATESEMNQHRENPMKGIPQLLSSRP